MVNTELSIRIVKVAVEVLLFPHASVDVKATPIEELQEVVVQVWVKWLSLHTRLLSHKSVATAPPFVASHAIYPYLVLISSFAKSISIGGLSYDGRWLSINDINT